MESPYGQLWRHGTEAKSSGGRVVDMILEAIESYSFCGVEINKSSKLHRAAKIFENSSNGSISADLYVAVAKLAIEHLFISRMIVQGGYSVSCLRSQLSHCLSGGLHWRDDADRRAESFQFELFVASTFWLAGIEVEFAEPDLLVKMGGETIGIASKYLFSEKKARRLSRNAVSQIRKSKRRGIIACGLSLFVPTVVEGKPREDAGEPLDFSRVVPPVIEIDKAAEGEPGVVGRIAFIYTAAFQRDPSVGYMRIRMDVRPYLAPFLWLPPYSERDRWLLELQKYQKAWSERSAGILSGADDPKYQL